MDKTLNEILAANKALESAIEELITKYKQENNIKPIISIEIIENLNWGTYWHHVQVKATI